MAKARKKPAAAPATSETREERRQRRDDEKLLDKVRNCFKRVSDAESNQRRREREDLLFQIPERQWDDAAKAERMGNVGGVPTPGRPMISISLIKQPYQLVKNQAQRARLGVNLHPVSEQANEELAEVMQGLYRRIERDGGADLARMWAFSRALWAGRGYYRVVCKYDEDADPSGPGAWDQEIGYQRILHQENVYVDPASQEPDASDAKWVLLVAWMTQEDFEREFPKSKLATSDSGSDWEELAEQQPDWVTAASESDDRAVLVAEYWYKHVTRETITDPKDETRQRTRDVVSVHCCKVTGNEVLEKQEWDGVHIPIVQVLGEELIPVEGERIYHGMVRPARDAQRGYNYAVSAAVEDVGRLSKVPYAVEEQSIEGYEDQWLQANRRNFPYLKYRAYDKDGKQLPAPMPMQIDGSKLQISLGLADSFKGMVNAATAVHEPSLGELPQRRDAQSGRAIIALQQQADAGTSHYLHNLTVAMRQEARIVLDLIPHKYDRPGRITQILTGEDETQTIMVGRPFVEDQKTGRPRKALAHETARAKNYNLRDARYSISVDIGKSHQTRLEAGQQFMAELISAYPQLMEFGADLVLKFRDEPGAKELADRSRKVIAGKYPGLLEEKGVAAPEVAQAKVQALEQQLTALTGQLQVAMEQIQTDRAKQEATLVKARMDNEARVTVAKIDQLTELLKETIRGREKAAQSALDRAQETQEHNKDLALEVGMAAASAQVANRAAAVDQAAQGGDVA